MLCSICDKRDRCVKICDEVEYALKNVTVGLKERFIIPADSIPTMKWELPATEINAFDCGLTQKYKGEELKQIIIDLYNEGKTYREIAYYQGIGCNYQYVHKIISAYKKSSVYQRSKQNCKQYSRLRKKRLLKKQLIRRGFQNHGGFFERFR